MEEKLIGVRQGELYIFEGFPAEGSYLPIRTMRPLFQSEIDELNEPNAVLDYAEEIWRNMSGAGKTELGLKEFANICKDESDRKSVV